MVYVYILKSINFPEQTYVGFTKNLSARLKIHNDGLSLHTAKFKPWKIESYLVFSDLQLAIEFEKYLKTAAGKKLMHNRLIKQFCAKGTNKKSL